MPGPASPRRRRVLSHRLRVVRRPTRRGPLSPAGRSRRPRRRPRTPRASANAAWRRSPRSRHQRAPTGDAATAYDALTVRLRKLADLDAVEATLQWDELVMMPDRAAEARGGQKATLAELKQSHLRGDRRPSSLRRKPPAPARCAWRAANIRDARRDYDDAVRVPASLKARKAELGAKATRTCTRRAANDFASFAPVLEELVALRKAFADACADEGVQTYDYLLDQFERGMTSRRLTEIFGELRRELAPVIKTVLEGAPLEQHPIFADGDDAVPGAFRRRRGAFLPRGRAEDGLQIRHRAVRHVRASVHRRLRAVRRAHHDEVRRDELHGRGDGGDPRGGPRAVRARLERRPGRPSRGARVVDGDPREPELVWEAVRRAKSWVWEAIAAIFPRVLPRP